MKHIVEPVVQWCLTAKVDDVTVYYSEFPTLDMLEEDGLRKASHAVEKAVEEAIEFERSLEDDD